MIAQLLFAWFLIADNWLEARIGRELLYKRSTVFSNPMSLLTGVSRLTKENHFFSVPFLSVGPGPVFQMSEAKKRKTCRISMLYSENLESALRCTKSNSPVVAIPGFRG